MRDRLADLRYRLGVDDLTGLIDGPRARGAFALRVSMSAPWGIEIRDEAPMSVVVVATGEAHVVLADGGTTGLRPGDLALVRGPDAYRVLDEPDRPVDVVILPGQRCASPTGESMTERMTLGPGSWGNAADGETTMIVGSYLGEGELGRRLLDALPGVVTVARADGASPTTDALVALLSQELGQERPGQRVVLDRLLDVLVVAVLRTWAQSPEAAGLPWAAALADPEIADTLRRLHAEPARAWSVAELARAAGLSRAAFSRRFTQVVGEPPIAYLTRWRMDLAADLLSEGGATVAAVGRAVGYPDPFAFSAAFKRQRGRSPRAFRTHRPPSPARA
jgi:AraC-like DNA-binding protein